MDPWMAHGVNGVKSLSKEAKWVRRKGSHGRGPPRAGWRCGRGGEWMMSDGVVGVEWGEGVGVVGVVWYILYCVYLFYLYVIHLISL